MNEKKKMYIYYFDECYHNQLKPRFRKRQVLRHLVFPLSNYTI